MVRNDDVTVINELKGNYYSTFIQGISMIGKSARTVSNTGIVCADYFTLRIPRYATDSAFVDASDWILQPTPPQSAIQCENLFELETEDGKMLTTDGRKLFSLIPQKTYIVIGKVKTEELCNIVELMKSHKVHTVMSVSDNSANSLGLKHWRCDCK